MTTVTRDEIIKLAREAGFITGVTHASGGFHHPFAHPVTFATCLTELERFAALVAAAEREACAKVCEARYMGDNNREDMEARRCSAAIRARSST